MMNRRSTSRSRRRSTEMASETRQPQQEDGRSSRCSSSQQQSNNNVPRSPRSTPGNQQQQTTPSKSQSSMTHPKTRCYRLNLEKPFDIRTCKSPLGRDYSGPPIHESDLPPVAGPVEYYHQYIYVVKRKLMPDVIHGVVYMHVVFNNQCQIWVLT